MKTVKVAKLGAPKKDVILEVRATIRDVLNEAGLDPGGFEVLLNGKESKLTSFVEPGDIVVLVPQIRGG